MSLVVPARRHGEARRPLLAALAFRPSRLAVTLAAATAVLGASAGPAFAADTTPPSRPYGVTVKVDPSSVAGTSFDISWLPATDDTGVTAYDVYSFTKASNGQGQLLGTVSGDKTSLNNVAIPGDPSAGVSITARDAAGNASDPSYVVRANTCPAVSPPTVEAPMNLTAANVTGTSMTFLWSGSRTDGCGDVNPTGYQVYSDEGADQPRLLATTDASLSIVRLTGLTPGTTYRLFVKPTGGARNLSSAEFLVTTLPAPATPDTTPPTAPNPLSVSISRQGRDSNQATLTWGASTDDVKVIGYDLYQDGSWLQSFDAGTTTADIYYRPNGSQQSPFSLVAVDEAGNTSVAATTTANTCRLSPGPPYVVGPTDVKQSGGTTTSLALSWTPAAVTACGQIAASGFDVFSSDHTLLTSVPADATSATVTGLKINTAYQLHVHAEGGAQVASNDSAFGTNSKEIFAFTKTNPTINYAITGASTLKSLVTGTLPLSGAASTTFDTDAGTFTSDLTLQPTTANLKVLGFLPVSASVQFVPTAPVTGTFSATSLSATAKVRIKLPVIKVAGLQLFGGANCQAAQISTIPLASVGPFVQDNRSTLAGTFSISNLTGCGILNGLASTLTASNGNAITLTLQAPLDHTL